MALRFKNTLTRQVEDFVPIKEGEVRMYTCGPTVYSYAHIGNFRTFMFEDLLRRYLKYKGYKVNQVMNITDIDDKIIRDSIKQNKNLQEFTAPFTKAFFEDIETLGIEKADHYPHATEYIPQMVEIVKQLKANDMAYEIDGNYYYRISAYKEYGKLAHLDMEGLKPGARVAADEYAKDSVSDFALWKAWDEKDGNIFWETDIGKGRPGWHLECSAMSMNLLGQQFDIHTGGVDNIFPHHENEIAQSEGATGKKFVNYWMHSEHLIVEGKKMSKSLGNFFTLRDILDKGYSGKAVRFVLISTHYRQQLNFTFEGLDAASNSLERHNDFIANLKQYGGDESDGSAREILDRVQREFEAALDDDLNISGALGAVFDFIRDINRLKAEDKLSVQERDKALEIMKKFDTVLNFTSDREEFLDVQVEALIQKRNNARKSKDFATSDKIRDQLIEMGIILEDTPQGVRWKRKV